MNLQVGHTYLSACGQRVEIVRLYEGNGRFPFEGVVRQGPGYDPTQGIGNFNTFRSDGSFLDDKSSLLDLVEDVTDNREAPNVVEPAPVSKPIAEPVETAPDGQSITALPGAMTEQIRVDPEMLRRTRQILELEDETPAVNLSEFMGTATPDYASLGLVGREALTAFLYLLMRDHVSFGTVEKVLQELQGCRDRQVDEILYSERLQSEYARAVADNILNLKRNST